MKPIFLFLITSLYVGVAYSANKLSVEHFKPVEGDSVKWLAKRHKVLKLPGRNAVLRYETGEYLGDTRIILDDYDSGTRKDFITFDASYAYSRIMSRIRLSASGNFAVVVIRKSSRDLQDFVGDELNIVNLSSNEVKKIQLPRLAFYGLETFPQHPDKFFIYGVVGIDWARSSNVFVSDVDPTLGVLNTKIIDQGPYGPKNWPEFSKNGKMVFNGIGTNVEIFDLFSWASISQREVANIIPSFRSSINRMLFTKEDNLLISYAYGASGPGEHSGDVVNLALLTMDLNKVLFNKEWVDPSFSINETLNQIVFPNFGKSINAIAPYDYTNFVYSDVLNQHFDFVTDSLMIRKWGYTTYQVRNYLTGEEVSIEDSFSDNKYDVGSSLEKNSAWYFLSDGSAVKLSWQQ